MKPPSAYRAIAMLALALITADAAHAQTSPSDLSEASLVPVAISAALPIVLVAGAGSVVVTGVEASAEGTVWVVENVANGVKGSICFAGQVAGTTLVVVGAVITVTAVATGTMLSAAGRVIAFIPNEIGRSLSYNQRVSR